MSNLPGVTELTKSNDPRLTIDMRVLFGKNTDRQFILDEVFRSYTNLISSLQERFESE